MDIPRERLKIRFSRSGGPGGQNVNRVETKVEIRFELAAADWIPPGVRERLKALARGRITEAGELCIASTRFRTQRQNLEDCIRKLSRLLELASVPPPKRIRTRPTASSRGRWRKAKRLRSLKKSRRRAGGFDE